MRQRFHTLRPRHLRDGVRRAGPPGRLRVKWARPGGRISGAAWVPIATFCLPLTSHQESWVSNMITRPHSWWINVMRISLSVVKSIWLHSAAPILRGKHSKQHHYRPFSFWIDMIAICCSHLTRKVHIECVSIDFQSCTININMNLYFPETTWWKQWRVSHR